MATTSINYGSTTNMTVTNLNSLSNSATVGWQSVRVDNISSVNADDYEISVKLTMANTAPANDKTAYVYISAAYMESDASWYHDDGGTTTLPSGSEGSYTIANPNNLKKIGQLSYTTQQMVMQGTFLLSNVFGNFIPDGFSIIIINYTGAAVSASGNVVQYRPIKRDIT